MPEKHIKGANNDVFFKIRQNGRYIRDSSMFARNMTRNIRNFEVDNASIPRQNEIGYTRETCQGCEKRYFVHIFRQKWCTYQEKPDTTAYSGGLSGTVPYRPFMGGQFWTPLRNKI